MQIVIDIPDEVWDKTKEYGHLDICGIELSERVINGTPLPKGHGRLIDVDAIPEQIELKGFLSQDNAHLVTIDRVKGSLNNAPTIIEADRSDKE